MMFAVHIVCFVLFFLPAFFTGALFLPETGKKRKDFYWRALLCYTLGMAVFSFLFIWLGNLGMLRAPLILAVVILLPVAGFVRLFISFRKNATPQLQDSFPNVKSTWNGLKTVERVFLVLISTWILILSINILIGGMAPDFTQDSMWYHLSVPGQWTISGRADAFPGVMPSTYPLAMEACYSGGLLLGNAFLCPLLYSQVTLAMLFLMILGAGRMGGGRAGFIAAGVIVGFHAALSAVSPLPSGNDNFASLLLLAGFLLLLDRFQNRSIKGWGKNLFLAGFLLETAAAAKIFTLFFSMPMILVFLFWKGRNSRGKIDFPREILFISAGAILAYLPWGARAWIETGNPFFPVATGVFPPRDEFTLSLYYIKRLHSLYPATPAGALEMVREIPEKIRVMLVYLHVMFPLFVFSAGYALFRKERMWRIQGAVLSFCLVFFLVLDDECAFPRFFSICYPLAVPSIAKMLGAILSHLRKRARYFLLALFMFSSIGLYGKRQLEVARFRTIRWKFRPVLSDEARDEYARFAEQGGLYIGFKIVRPHIPKDAYVFLPDCNYPFYLERRCFWWDEVCGRIRRPWWLLKDPEWIGGFIRRNHFDYILITGSGRDVRLDALIREGLLRDVPLEAIPYRGWVLYEVRRSYG